MHRFHTKGFVAALSALSAVAISAVIGSQLSDVQAFAQSAPAAKVAVPVVPASARPDMPKPPAKEGDAAGLAVTFFAGVGEKPESADTRISRMLALYVPAGQAASPLTPAGPFTAVFDGALNLRLRDTYTFSAEGRGKLVVTINDKPAFTAEGDDFTKAAPPEPLRLNKGKNKLAVRYESPATGDASFRLLWTVKGDNYPYSIPPTALTHDTANEAVAAGVLVREGRQHIADLRCVKCHAVPGIEASTYPDIHADAPDLSAIGARVNKDWLTAWVNNPQSLRPTSHMPRLFKAGDADAIDPRAADVAAYLATLGNAAGVEPAADDEKIALGGQLFTHLNCAVCHEPPAPPENAAPPAEPEADGEEAPPVRIPLKYVKAKYKPAALVEFLKNPAAHYAWISMPNFGFKPNEAEALAAFLLSEAAGTLPENLPAGDAAKGKALVASSGCINCHKVGDEKSTLQPVALNAIEKEKWSAGCLSADDAARKAAPAYALTDPQKQAITAFAASDRRTLWADTPAEFAARQVKALNCNGCHARDGKESLLATIYDAEHKELEQKYPAAKGDHAEAFSPDQRAPLMTWFGEKLRPQWSAKFIAGEVAYKPRPYLHARMPAFKSRAAWLAEGLAAEHGVGTSEPAYPKPDAEMSATGSKLAGKTPNAAFQCTQCHAVAKNPPFAPFEAPAINFMHVSERLRKDYYHRWMHNPILIDTNTKMPAFEREGEGKTTILTTYDGDARKQFEAIWQYLLEADKIKPPAE
jgi:mono/diheme cytochrome c family protein